MPYFLLAVRIGKGLAKLIPIVGDISRELAHFAKTAGEGAVKLARKAPNIWYKNLITEREREVCDGAELFLETAMKQFGSAAKSGSVEKPDLRALSGLVSM